MTQSHEASRIAAIVAGMIVLGLSTTTGRDRKNYEVDAQVYSVPVTQSDASRAISAYERLMERHMDLTEQNLAALAVEIQSLTAKLDAVDAGLAQMDQRLARIEKHLGVVPPPCRPDPSPPAEVPATLRRIGSRRRLTVRAFTDVLARARVVTRA